MARVDYDTSDRTRWYSMFSYQHGTEFGKSQAEAALAGPQSSTHTIVGTAQRVQHA